MPSSSSIQDLNVAMNYHLTSLYFSEIGTLTVLPPARADFSDLFVFHSPFMPLRCCWYQYRTAQYGQNFDCRPPLFLVLYNMLTGKVLQACRLERKALSLDPIMSQANVIYLAKCRLYSSLTWVSLAWLTLTLLTTQSYRS